MASSFLVAQKALQKKTLLALLNMYLTQVFLYLVYVTACKPWQNS